MSRLGRLCTDGAVIPRPDGRDVTLINIQVIILSPSYSEDKDRMTENRNIWSMCVYNNTLNDLNYLNVSEASALCPLLYCYKTEDSTSLTAPSV